MASDAISGIGLLWGMIKGLIEGYGTQRKGLFENHIEPLQEKMISIHKDYITGFEEVRRHLKDRTKPPTKLIEFLRERRREYEYERQLANDLATEIAKIRKVAIKDKDLEAVEMHTKAILEYFSTSSGIAGISWYSDFLDMVASKSRLGFDNVDVWMTTAISGNPRKDLLQIVDIILDRDLPAAFARLSASYAILRARLL